MEYKEIIAREWEERKQASERKKKSNQSINLTHSAHRNL